MKYRKIHPFSKRAYNAKRRARKYGTKGEFTRYTIERLYCTQRGKCAICKEYLFGKFEVDHIKPLSKDGENSPENIQLLCPKCNKKKGSKYAEVSIL
jgi:5-methylcytosine-specific restriction endonuclease McrA